MNKSKKRILSILLGAMVTIPSISVLAETNTDENTIVRSATLTNSFKEMKNEIFGENLNVNLTEKQKEVVKKIIADFRAGDITREEAAQKLKSLGVNLNEKNVEFKNVIKSFKDGDIAANQLFNSVKDLGLVGRIIKTPLTEDQKSQLKDIKANIASGLIAKEDANVIIKGMGIDFGLKKDNKASNLMTDEQKEVLKTIKEELKAGTITREEAAQKIKDLGLKFEKLSRKVTIAGKLSEEQKETIAKLREEVRSGEITKEEYYSAVKSIIAE